MEICFHKYQGTGNDFIMIDDREGDFPAGTEFIAALCNRRFGIGADGLILIQKASGYDFRMVYLNSDGRESTFCGNGGRCAAAFARQLGMIAGEAHFVARDGEHYASLSGDMVRLKMTDAKLPVNEKGGFVLFTGSPHFVSLCRDAASVNVSAEGRSIRMSFGEEGINVNFMELRPGYICIRTYERGVEDETLSCGTGVTASALVAAGMGYPSPVTVESRGGHLQVEFDRQADGFTGVYLNGPAVHVFSGNISPRKG